jgi:hypothetical protein
MLNLKDFDKIKKHFERCEHPEKFFQKRKKQFNSIDVSESRNIQGGSFIIDNIVYINLDSAVERRKETEKAFKSANIKSFDRFSAIAGIDYPTMSALTLVAENKTTNLLDVGDRLTWHNSTMWDEEKTERILNSLKFRNKAAAVISHSKLMDLCVNKYNNWVLAFEDDFTLNYNFEEFLEKVRPLTEKYDLIVTESRQGLSQRNGTGMGACGYMYNCSKIPKDFKKYYCVSDSKYFSDYTAKPVYMTMSADDRLHNSLRRANIRVTHMEEPFVNSYGLHGFSHSDSSYRASTIAVNPKLNCFNEG